MGPRGRHAGLALGRGFSPEASLYLLRGKLLTYLTQSNPQNQYILNGLSDQNHIQLGATPIMRIYMMSAWY